MRLTRACLCFLQQKKCRLHTEVCLESQADGKFCFLSDREMEGSVLSVAIMNGRVWLEGLNSSHPLEA